MTNFITIPDALERLRNGQMLILVDDDDREQEGDLICPAQSITSEQINFMIQKARGLVCLTLSQERLAELQIPALPERFKMQHQAAFMCSIEAREGIKTGVSPEDRAHTILTAINPSKSALDIAMPGHVFPLAAKPGGVLERQGHTEGSIDLVSLAGLEKGAVICEIINDDGSMARMPALQTFSERYQIPIVKIADIIDYRQFNEDYLVHQVSSHLPLLGLDHVNVHLFYDPYEKREHIAVVFGHATSDITSVRIHSECMTGDVFGSLRCDCGEQLTQSLALLKKEGGGVDLFAAGRSWDWFSE